jgi:ribosomal protein S13
VLQGIWNAFRQAAVETGKELLTMFTVDRLTAALTNYMREQAGTWATKTILDAGNQEWLAKALHAFGLDAEDLIEASRRVLDSGFATLTGEMSTVLRKSSEDRVSAERLTSQTLRDNALLSAENLGTWSLYQSTNYASEEEKTRMLTSAIFSETDEKIRGKANLTYSEQVSALRSKADEEIDAHLPGVIKTLGAHLKPIQDWMNNISLTARDSIFYLLVPRVPVDYEHVGATGMAAFTSAFSLGLAAHGVAAAVDLLHPLKATHVNQLAAFLANMAGFGAISKETWYEDMRNFLGTPYMHYSRRYFRPTLPRERDLLEMMTEGDILYEDYERAMQYWGYRDPWIKPLLTQAYRDISPFQLALCLEDPVVSPADLYKMCRSANLEPHDCEVMTNSLNKKSLTTYIIAVKAALVNLRKEGYITEEQLDTQLEPLELRSEANTLIKKEARLKYLFDFTSDSLSMFTDMYNKDLLDEDDFRIALTSLGIEEAKRNLIINRATVKKTAKIVAAEKTQIKKEIRKQQELIEDIYIAEYRASTISEEALYNALVFSGISAEIATLTVELEKQKKTTVEKKKAISAYESEQEKIRKKYESAYIGLFRDDLIDVDTFTDYMRMLEYEDDYITAIIDTETYKKQTPQAIPSF